MTERLFAQVKNKLNITWEDEDTTARVENIVKSAIPYLKHKLGITDPDFDFAEEGNENTLFLACCLYDYNHASRNEFEDNYSYLIADIRAKNAVEYYFASEGGEDE